MSCVYSTVTHGWVRFGVDETHSPVTRSPTGRVEQKPQLLLNAFVGPYSPNNVSKHKELSINGVPSFGLVH